MKLLLASIATAFGLIASFNILAETSHEITLRCQSPKFPTDYEYVGIYENKERVDVVSYSTNGLLESASELEARLKSTSNSFRMEIRDFKLSLNRTSLVLTSTSSGPYGSSRDSNCSIQPNNSGIAKAIGELKQQQVKKEQEERRRLKNQESNRKI
jgi:hypothetical protein